MRTFFKGWRRKAGCLTLLMACAVMGMWLRSHFLIECLEISVQDREHCFGSFHGFLSWRSWDKNWGVGTTWQSFPASMVSSEALRNLKTEHAVGSRTRQWVIPHAWVVPLLTVLAAWLILWKPRTKPKVPQDA